MWTLGYVDVASAFDLDLDDSDVLWAVQLGNSMVTAALSVANDDAGAAGLCETVRDAAFEVRFDDGRAAQRWMLVMFLLAARSAGLCERVSRYEGGDGSSVWRREMVR